MRLTLLKGFNNYFNRRVRLYDTLSDYTINSNDYFTFAKDANFNLNDGISTTHVFNILNFADPDYLIVEDSGISPTIKSRWFVLDWIKQNGSQYKAILKRDVIADYYNQMSTALSDIPCLVERGPLRFDSPFIFNKENVSLNQIKTSQTTLPDETKFPWIVAYVEKGYQHSGEISSVAYQRTVKTPSQLGITLNDATDITKGGYIAWAWGDNETDDPNLQVWMQIRRRNKAYWRLVVGATVSGLTTHSATYLFDNTASFAREFVIDMDPFFFGDEAVRIAGEYKHYLDSYSTYSSMKSDLFSIEDDLTTQTKGNVIANREDNLVYYNSKYYKIEFDDVQTVARSVEARSSGQGVASYNNFHAAAVDLHEFSPAYNLVSIGDPYEIAYTRKYINLRFVETTGPNQEKVEIANDRNQLIDAPYDMMCCKLTESNLSLMQKVKTAFGDHMYDLQILPYCPARFAIDNNALVINEDYSSIKNSSDVEVDRLYYCRKSSDSFSINKNISIVERTGIKEQDIKLSNECDYYRLSAPNHSSSFEFSVAKNGGVDGFVVYFTYRPVSPYIRITPNFSGLYGSNFNDSRGLILQGDYSVDTISNAWINYQIQNKNYENIFNAKIKSMDQLHSLGVKQAGIGIVTSIGKGAAAGALAGGNPATAAIGAAAGLVTGATNMAMQSQQYQITRQLEVDNYNFALGNVKALPDTLSKISSYSVDNTYYPVVEYYTCSSEEEKMIEERIDRFNYSINAILDLREFLNTYGGGANFFKAQIITNIQIFGNEHIAYEINNEFMKGLYL